MGPSKINVGKPDHESQKGIVISSDVDGNDNTNEPEMEEHHMTTHKGVGFDVEAQNEKPSLDSVVANENTGAFSRVVGVVLQSRTTVEGAPLAFRSLPWDEGGG